MRIYFKNLIIISVLFFSFLEGKTYQNVNPKIKKHTTQKQKEKLFKSIGCTYSNLMKIDPTLELVPPYQTQQFKDSEKTILDLSEKYRKDVERGVLAPMYLEFVSPIVGYGIKAVAPIKKGDFIGVYAGYLRNLRYDDPEFKEDVDYAWYYAVPDKHDKNIIIDGKYEGNELRFINHASDPNTKRIDVIVGNVFYVCYIALKDIEKDEELTVNYGEGYWSSRGIEPEIMN